MTERLRAAAALDAEIRDGIGDSALDQLLETLAGVAGIAHNASIGDASAKPVPEREPEPDKR